MMSRIPLLYQLYTLQYTTPDGLKSLLMSKGHNLVSGFLGFLYINVIEYVCHLFNDNWIPGSVQKRGNFSGISL